MKSYDYTVDNMVEVINNKIADYERKINACQYVIDKREEEIKAERYDFSIQLYKSTQRAMQAQIDVYYQAIKDMEEVKEAMFL